MSGATNKLLWHFLLSAAQTSFAAEYQPMVVVFTGFNCALQLGGKGPGEGRGLFRSVRSAFQVGSAQLERGAGRGRGSRAGWDRDAGAAWGSAACPLCKLQPLFFLGAEEIYALWVQERLLEEKRKEREKENENDFNFFLA